MAKPLHKLSDNEFLAALRKMRGRAEHEGKPLVEVFADEAKALSQRCVALTCENVWRMLTKPPPFIVVPTTVRAYVDSARLARFRDATGFTASADTRDPVVPVVWGEPINGGSARAYLLRERRAPRGPLVPWAAPLVSWEVSWETGVGDATVALDFSEVGAKTIPEWLSFLDRADRGFILPLVGLRWRTEKRLLLGSMADAASDHEARVAIAVGYEPAAPLPGVMTTPWGPVTDTAENREVLKAHAVFAYEVPFHVDAASF